MGNNIVDKIYSLKQMRNAIILSHFYERPEIQDIGDFVGDSLELSRKAASTNADVIVFCGVHFMAETASILSPDKKVLLPNKSAGCPMADMAAYEEVKKLKERYPNAVVVSYINTTADVKTISDICCTSANAVKVINSIPLNKEIIFVPDKNLGNYVSKETGRKLILWQGYCNTHDRLTAEEVLLTKERYPYAKVVAHPECREEVIQLADGVFSTSGIIKYVGESEAKEFIICTEEGIIHQLEIRYPNKVFILPSNKLICPDMKKITLEDVFYSLENLRPEVKISDEVREKAIIPIKRMLDIK
ncbi:quinolinate synthase NadA [Aceticella autotrophica]|uniref:Quinolinate synthase n=1 Tax=Aceticella autotrophica TaxID=2755338 RepID=A0A975GAR5_9THEO|nr:quinolinate synthase NadA [Aceticella autotrophica]QSZ27683.1 quinolinate synthase NadA [Aceticella autotrophica]